MKAGLDCRNNILWLITLWTLISFQSNRKTLESHFSFCCGFGKTQNSINYFTCPHFPNTAARGQASIENHLTVSLRGLNMATFSGAESLYVNILSSYDINVGCSACLQSDNARCLTLLCIALMQEEHKMILFSIFKWWEVKPSDYLTTHQTSYLGGFHSQTCTYMQSPSEKQQDIKHDILKI